MLDPTSEALSRRIKQTEAEFIDCLYNPDSLSSFELPWSALTSDLLKHMDAIDAKTGAAAYATASRISIVAQSLSNVYAESSALDMSLNSELGNILNSIYPEPKTRCENRYVPSDSKQVQPQRSSAFDVTLNHAGSRLSIGGVHCEWLIEHLHNPFPPAPKKKELAKSLSMTPKSLDDWFSNARRKIGWIAFSKRHFQGNRSLTLDCAHRVWVEGKSQMYNEEVIRELEEVKITAQRLYGSPDKTNASETSCFAKEIESLEAETVTVSRSRKRRPSTCSNASEQTIVSSASSGCPSRKRARASSGESDATCCEDQTLSLKPFKRARSVSSACSSASQETSFSTLSSDSADTVSEVSTPAMSPTHPHLPIEIFDGWIDGLSSGSPFLPHYATDKPPEKALSQKRASPDSDSDTDTDVPSKRARLGSSREPLPPPAAKDCDTPNPKLSQSVATALAEAAPPSPTHTPTKASVDLSPTNESTTIALVQPAAAEEVDVEAAKAILSQLDFSVPPPPIWDDKLVESALEATLLSLASCGAGAGAGAGEIGSSSGLPEDIDALWAKAPVLDTALPAAGESSVGPQILQECTNEPNDATDDSRIAFADHCESMPLSLSSLDFDFLESLGNIAPVPSVNTETAPVCDNQLFAPLIDIAPIPESDRFAFDNSERTEKLERIEQLLAEAQKLQQEVFG
ncbi:hypothetical protein ACEPAH_989 [Sanghuangporus vaninii]